MFGLHDVRSGVHRAVPLLLIARVADVIETGCGSSLSMSYTDIDGAAVHNAH